MAVKRRSGRRIYDIQEAASGDGEWDLTLGGSGNNVGWITEDSLSPKGSINPEEPQFVNVQRLHSIDSSSTGNFRVSIRKEAQDLPQAFFTSVTYEYNSGVSETLLTADAVLGTFSALDALGNTVRGNSWNWSGVQGWLEADLGALRRVTIE